MPPRSDRPHPGQASDFLAAHLEGSVQVGAEVGPFTSYRLGGPAAICIDPAGEHDLAVVSDAIKRFGLPCLVLGKGSNVLISDQGFDGIVIRLGAAFEWMTCEGKVVEAGGAAALPKVANLAARRGLAGMEFAVAIPATVGGAVRMNAGAHGASISDVLSSARIYRLLDGAAESVPPAQLKMGYRSTSIGAADIVCSARFQLKAGSVAQINSSMRRYRLHRTATQPSEAPNAGSVFRNPKGGSAGTLIEQAGLKGRRVGGAEVSGKHANFFLAHPGSTAQDVYDLMRQVQKEVLERFGVLLDPEVRPAGSFSGEPLVRRAEN